MVAKSPGRVQASQGRKPATPVVHGAGCGGPAAAHLTVKVLSLLHLGRNARGAHSLELDTDWAMPWMLGDCGVLQYWISLSDLRAERFDRVRVTLEGH